MLSRSIALTLLFLFVATAVSSAQEREYIENTLGVGPRFGWYKSNEAEEGAWYFGMMGRFRLGKNIGFEGALDYRIQERFLSVRENEREYSATVTYMPVTLSLMIFAPFGSRYTPYGVAGVGWYLTLVDYDPFQSGIPEIRRALEDETSFIPGYHFGLGLEIVLSRGFALHGDFRYLFLGTEISKIKDVVTADIDTKNSNGIIFSAGFIVYI